MGFNKSFVVKNGIEVSTDLLVGQATLNNVGVGTTQPSTKLDVQGSFQASGTGRISGISTAETTFNVGVAGTTLHVDPTDSKVGILTNVTTHDVTVVGHSTVTGNVHITGITTSDHLVVTGIATVNNFEAVGLTSITNVRVSAGLVTVTQLTSTNANVTGVATVGGAVTMSSTGIDVNTIDVESLTGRGINITGGITASGTIGANNYTGNGSALTGIVTGIVAGDNISVNGTTGTVTITGLANTANVSADTLVVTGITTLGVVTNTTAVQATNFYGTFVGDGSLLTGIDTTGNFSGKTVVCENVFASSPGIGTFGSVVINNPAGRITATQFYGDGGNLTNTGAALSDASGTQKLVVTSVGAGGTMDTAAIDANLTFNATTNTLSCTNFSGDGANLTNTGSTLSEPSSGTQRIVTTSLTTGTMTSSGTGAELAFDYANNHLEFSDNTKAAFGDELEIYSTGNRTEIVGKQHDINIIAEGSDTNILFRADSGTGDYLLQANKGGEVALYYNGSKKFQTQSGGAIVTGTMTATTFSGSGASLNSIPNSALDNSSISGISLGSNLATLTRGTYLTGDNYNGGTARTWAVDATSANTASKVVARDGSGNFSAGTITATLSGTATNADNCRVDADNSTDASHFITFTGSATGNQRLNSDTSLTYNPNSNTLTVANLNGNATTATNANNAGTLDGIDSSSFLRSDTADTASAKITFDAGIRLNDNDSLEIGSSADYKITFDGDDAYHNLVSSDLYFQNNAVNTIIFDMSAGAILPASNDTGTIGSSTVYWNKGHFSNIQVNSTLDVRGAIDLHDNDILRFGDADDVEFFFDGSNFYLDLNSGGNNFIIRDGTTTRFTFDDAGTFTSTGAITSGGDVTLSGQLNMTSGSDANRYIDVALGSNSLYFRGTSGGDASHTTMAVMTRGGAVELYHNNSKKLETTSSGITVTGDVNSTSDIRQKENISIIEDSMSILNQIDGVRYDWKNTKTPSLGVIAQTVEKVLPELVDENDEGVKSVKYNGLTGLLIEAVKELSARVEELENK